MEPKQSISFRGTVRSGQGKGKTLGAATANLDVKLAKGINKGLYRCQVVWRSQLFRGLLYFGLNSLSGRDCLEVHIAGLDENIVGKKIQIIIGAFLRPPQIFDNVKKLQSQIKRDLRSINII